MKAHAKQVDKISFEKFIEGKVSVEANGDIFSLPVIIMRRALIDCRTCSGALASAILYSLIETAKANAIDCHVYLAHRLSDMPQREVELEPLLSWHFAKDQQGGGD